MEWIGNAIVDAISSFAFWLVDWLVWMATYAPQYFLQLLLDWFKDYCAWMFDLNAWVNIAVKAAAMLLDWMQYLMPAQVADKMAGWGDFMRGLPVSQGMKVAMFFISGVIHLDVFYLCIGTLLGVWAICFCLAGTFWMIRKLPGMAGW